MTVEEMQQENEPDPNKTPYPTDSAGYESPRRQPSRKGKKGRGKGWMAKERARQPKVHPLSFSSSSGSGSKVPPPANMTNQATPQELVDLMRHCNALPTDDAEGLTEEEHVKLQDHINCMHAWVMRDPLVKQAKAKAERGEYDDWHIHLINFGLLAAPTCFTNCLLYTSPSPRDGLLSRMPSSA